MAQVRMNLIGNVVAKVREETLEGKKYLVATAAILEEGVWNGSKGKIYYPGKEVAKTPEVWNHKPMVFYHPELSGEKITACDPIIMESRKCGIMLNSIHNNKLRTETWFDVVKTEKLEKELGKEVLNKMRKGEQIEVSTGLFADLDPTSGVFNGQEYDYVASNLRADHLAILPDEEGAYSIAAGGGILANTAGDDTPKLSKEEYLEMQKLSIETLSAEKVGANILNDKGGSSFVANVISHQDVAKGLTQAMIEEQGKQMGYWPGYIEDVYDDFYVYSQDGMYYKRGYSVDATYNVNPFGNPEQVKKHQEYRDMKGNSVAVTKRDMSGSKVTRTQSATSHLKSGDKGTPEPTKADLSKTPGNRNELPGSGKRGLGMSSGSPSRSFSFNSKGDEKVATSTEVPVVANVTTAAVSQPAKEQTVDDYINNAPPGMRPVLRAGLTAVQGEKKSLVATILANKRNRFTKERLEEMEDLDELRNLAALATDPAVNNVNGNPPIGGARYFGAEGATPINNAEGTTVEQEVLTSPILNFDKAPKHGKKKKEEEWI